MKSPVATIQVIAFLDLLAAGLIVPQLPPQARSLGCGHILVGFMASLYSGLQLVSSPMTGSLSDIKGRLEVLVVSLSLSGVAYTLLGVTNSILLFLVLRGLLGITKHTQLLAIALTPDYVENKEELSAIYGKLNTLRQAGMAIGPIIGGYIVYFFPENGFTIVAFLVGAIFAVNSAIAPTLLNTVTTSFNESLEQFNKIDWSVYWEIFSFKLFISLCIGIFISNYVLFVKIKHDVSPVVTGYIIAVFSTVGSLTSFFVDKVNDFYKKDNDYTERNLHVFALLTISLIGVALAPNVFLYVVFVVPLGIASTMGSLITREVILCKTDDANRGTVLGVANNVRSVTGVIAPLLTGFIAHFVGVLQVVYVSIILAAVGTYKSYVIRTKKTVETKKK
ncbi:major facilitator superfamily domain-containing protein [Phthorimaea operculella]|nr:major facilitator superfamily domain-containing protein [Phthorimaea operculella]